MADKRKPQEAKPPVDANPTDIGQTGAEEIVGDKDKGVLGVDPSIPIAKPGDRQDADGTLTASAENDRNEGRGDIAVHHDADGSLTCARGTTKPATDIDTPLNADGKPTSNRQINGEARRASYEIDATDKALAGDKK